MPSPFPGMDPFLEHPVIFPDLHDSMVTYLREFLQSVLPEPYFATLGDRVWVEVSRRYIGPDIKVHHPRNGSAGGTAVSKAVAVAPRTSAQPVVVRVPHDEIREPFVEIYTRDGGERLVTSVEVLSLANKTPGDHGRDLYRRKQQELLHGQVHLVEIDLLRAGAHSTAVPLDLALAMTGPFDYHVCAHPFDDWEKHLVWPIRLEQTLPAIDVPLLPGHGTVPVDLQAVLDRCYDAGPYRRRVRYREMDIVPPLDEAGTEWVAQILRDKGLIPPAAAS